MVFVDLLRWITFAYELDPNCDSGPSDNSFHRHDWHADLLDVYWPVYNTTDDGTIITLEDQGGKGVRDGADTMRQNVYVSFC